MTKLERIREQIQRMRRAGVEPECVYLTPKMFYELRKPKEICGVRVTVEKGLTLECEVR